MMGFLDSDGELAASELSLETARALESGGPWGQHFPEPLFDGVFDVADSRVVGDRHLKLWLRQSADMRPIEAIAFGHFDDAQAARPAPGARLRLAYRLQSTTFGGTPRAEMLAEHLQACA
jgi:single-stranded-DNA-specific exonuclease